MTETIVKKKRGRQGEGGGRPSKYATAELFERKANEYFESCTDGTKIPNKAGILVHMGIADRSTWADYKKKFPLTIKAIENKIEVCWINRLAGNSPTGAIFYLKNAFKEDYKDRQETDVTSGGEKIGAINYVVPKQPDEKR